MKSREDSRLRLCNDVFIDSIYRPQVFLSRDNHATHSPKSKKKFQDQSGKKERRPVGPFVTTYGRPNYEK